MKIRDVFVKYTLLIFCLFVFLILGYCFALKRTSRETFNNMELSNKEWQNTANNAVGKYVGKILILPYVDSLYVSKSEYQKVCNFPLKIINFIDGDCSTCLAKIAFWEKFILEINSLGYKEIPIIMYASSSLENNLRDYMDTHWVKGKRMWFYDKEQKFIVQNEFYDLRMQTVLLNSENEVILIGDPLLNPVLKDLYIKTIISLIR